MVKISNSQLKKIWACARQLGLGETELREIVMTQTGSQSISHLSTGEAHLVIEKLVSLGATGISAGGKISPTQLQEINKLLFELDWFAQPERFKKFLAATGYQENAYVLTKSEGDRVIHDLQQLLTQKKSE